MITQERLKELFYYNPQFGIFVRKVSTSTNAKVGDIAGHLNVNGYIRMSVDCKAYQAHRLVFLYMNGEFPEHQVDHIKGVRADNRWSQLTAATDTENQKNAKKRIDNTSGITGIYWHKSRKKWMPRISIDGKQRHLGRFTDFFEACCIRKSAELKHGYHENHGRKV